MQNSVLEGPFDDRLSGVGLLAGQESHERKRVDQEVGRVACLQVEGAQREQVREIHGERNMVADPPGQSTRLDGEDAVDGYGAPWHSSAQDAYLLKRSVAARAHAPGNAGMLFDDFEVLAYRPSPH